MSNNISNEVNGLIEKANKQGIKLSFSNDDLILNMREETQPDPLILDELRANKQQLISFLKTIASYREKIYAIECFDRQLEFPIHLSFNQERLWFIHRIAGSVHYHAPIAIRIKGKLNEDTLTYALKEIVNRHEVLRTVILEKDGKPYQKIVEKNGMNLTVINGESYKDEAGDLSKEIKKLIAIPFDLSKDHMLRAHLIKLAEGDHVLVLNMHHIASDGRSLQILERELIELYTARSQRRDPQLAPLQIQYADFAMWQRKYAGESMIREKLEYWKYKLEGVALLELQSHRQPVTARGYEGVTTAFSIDAGLQQQLYSVGRRHEATLFMVLLSVFKLLLYRYTGQQDICVGSAITGRQRRELEDLVGFFMDTLPLRTQLRPDHSFSTLLQAVKTTTLEAYDHQEVPFEKIVEAVVRHRDPHRSPLFQVMFDLQNRMTGGMHESAGQGLQDLLFSPEKFEVNTSKYDLTFSFEEKVDGLRCAVSYNCDLFDGSSIGQMIRHYIQLLQSIVENQAMPIAELQMLGETERRQLLSWSQGPQMDYPLGRTVVELFREQALRHPGAVAVVCEEDQLSYAELEGRSNRLGQYLRRLGVREESLVAICVDRSLRMVLSMLGIWKAGGAYVPVDPAYPPERIGYMLADTGSRWLLTDRVSRERLPELPGVHVMTLDEEWAVIEAETTTPPFTQPRPEQLAYVIYTSGSTGRPKGVMIEHKSLVNYLFACKDRYLEQLAVTAGSFAYLSYSFDAAVTALFVPLLAGKTAVISTAGRSDAVFDSAAFRRNAPYDFLKLTPAHLSLLREAWTAGVALTKRLVIGGEALGGCHVDFLIDKADGLEIINEYGPTETTVGCSIYSFYTGGGVRPPQGNIPIGRPMANTRLLILDDGGQLSPEGVAGELYIGGVQVARGYWGRQALTAERFVADPFGGAGRLYRTGDRCRWLADGNIEYLGRLDQQVKIRGYRIEPGEIESVLSGADGVKAAAVVVREGRSDDKRLVGYVVMEGPFDREGLMAYLRELLPEYMLPAQLVKLDALPLTTSGKVDRKALPEPEQESAGGYTVPRNAMEAALAELWQELLEVERVGVYDDFFALGGHSLLAIRLIAATRKQLGYELMIKEVFDHPTIAGLAAVIQTKTAEQVPVLRAFDRTGPVPLSFSQERLWFIDRLEGSVAYHIPWVFRVEGRLDIAALSASLRQVLARHEVLRSVIVEREGRGYQQVQEVGDWQVDYDATRWMDADEASMRAALGRWLQQPFDLLAEWPLRVQVLRLADNQYLLAGVLHHIAGDGWSVGVLVKELTQGYREQLEGTTSALPPPPIQYGDYAFWQREEAQQAALAQQLDYWKKQLSGLEVLELPADRPRPVQASGRAGVVEGRLGSSVPAELKRLSEQQGATLFMTLLAVWKIVLWRYSGQRDIVVGSPVAGREYAELEELIGFFVNTVVLRTRLEGEWSFERLLQEVKEMTLSAYAHQQAPFEQIVEAVAVKRDMSRTPLFQVLFVLQNLPDAEALKLGKVKLMAEVSSIVLSKFDLTLSAGEKAGGLSLELVYSLDLFDRQRMERMLEHYMRLLQAVVTAPAMQISGLQLLGEQERQQLLSWSQGPQVAYPPEQTIVGLFREQVLRSPDAVALVFEQEQLSYAGLEACSNKLGHYLRRLGVREESLVVICMERSLNMVPGILGILKAGGAYVPVDPDYPAERIGYMLSDTGSRWVLTDRASRERLPELPGVRVVVLEEDWAMIEVEAATPPSTSLRADQLAYVIYTSGSTGRPKGVMVEHRSLVNRLQWAQSYFGLTADDAVLQKTTFCFDVSVWELLWPILTGSRIVMARPDGQRDAEYLKRVIREQGITTIHFVPSMLSSFLETLAEGEIEGLRRVICSGEALTPAQVEAFQKKAANTRLYNLYGPTEAAIDVSYWAAPEGGQRVEVVPIGRPVANTRLLILNRDGQLSPEGVAGELYIGGVQVARGYWGREALTAERFVADPFGGGGRLYRTGDRCRWLPGGQIEYLGRMDEQVKLRGYRIELGEIESVLSGAAGVKAAAVVVREGCSGDKQLVGYVVGEDGVDREALLGYLRDRLPEYMVPAQLVALEALPLTGSGKVDRKALPEPEQESGAGYAGPRDATEAALAALWQELLGIERVGIYDSFFALGGHSLLAMRLVAAIRRRLDREVSIRDIFLYPTVAGQSALLGTGKMALPPLERQEHTGPAPLSFSQERLWFIDRLEGSVAYHMPWVFRIDKTVDEAVLEASLRALIHRHEVLRTVIREENGNLYQYILEENGWRLGIDTLPDDSEPALEDRIRKLISYPFDLSKDHMLRANVIQTGRGSKILIVTLHHIAADGWTVAILAREWALFYAAMAGRDVVGLSPLTIRYADYAIWQRQYWNSGLLEKKMHYWSEKLKGITSQQLPGDQRGHVQTQVGYAIEATLDKEILQRLKEYCLKKDVTLFMVLMAVYKVLLYRYSGNKDICVGSPVSGRHYYELGDLAGYFLNTLPIRTIVKPDVLFADYLLQVKQTLLEAYENQDVPLEKIVEAIGKGRDLNKNPIFRVMFALQNNPSAAMGDHLLAEVLLSKEEVDTRTSKFDILLIAEEKKDLLGLKLEYHSGLFNSAMATRMLGHFMQLLHSILNMPGELTGHLPMLTSGERSVLTGVFNHTSSPMERHTITSLFEQQVCFHPEATALVFNGQSLSYFELHRRSNQLAHYLKRKGAKEKDLIPIYIERCPNMIISVLAILKIGASYVPIDIDYPELRVNHMVTECSSKLVISNSRSASRLNAYADLLVLDMDKEAAAIESEPERGVEVDIGPDHLVYILYTSGSTGKPKGVQMHMEALTNLLVWQQKQFQNKHQRRVLQFASLNFDVSFQEIFSTLCYGNTLFLIENHRRQDISLLVNDIKEFGITHLFVPYIVLKSIAEHLQDIGSYPTVLEEIITAGEQLKLTEDIRLMMNRTRAQLVNQYGPTEAHVVSSYTVEASDYEKWPMPPIGKPINNIQLHILDEDRELCPIGVQGEIYIGGVGVAKGYLGLPELTDQKFVYGFSENDKALLYRTGDRGQWLEDGNIEYMGRIDGQVKIRGHRVEPGEIEMQLQQSGLLTNSVVLTRKDSIGNNQLIAYVVAPGSFDREALILWLKARLPVYMIPAIFVRVESIPFNANGKIDKQRLDEMYVDDHNLQDGYIAPSNETESVLADIWKEFLKVDKVGIKDHFFSLGGHSLLMTPIASSIAKKLDVFITFQELFEYPTIEELAAYIIALRNAPLPETKEDDNNTQLFMYEK